MSTTPEVLLQASGLCAWYGAAQILFDVDLQVRKGEVVALMGRNGAGKSTTLKTIMGMVLSPGHAQGKQGGCHHCAEFHYRSSRIIERRIKCVFPKTLSIFRSKNSPPKAGAFIHQFLGV